VLYQYFEELHFKRYHRRNITISITICVGRERKKIIKQTFWECGVNEKRNFYKKKKWNCERKLFYSRRLFFRCKKLQNFTTDLVPQLTIIAKLSIQIIFQNIITSTIVQYLHIICKKTWSKIHIIIEKSTKYLVNYTYNI
jgi:hypothetical protein